MSRLEEVAARKDKLPHRVYLISFSGKFKMARGGKAESHPGRLRRRLALGKTQITAKPCGGVSLIKQNTCDGKGVARRQHK